MKVYDTEGKLLTSAGGGGGGTKIQDADADTNWDVEKTADEDKVHGKVKDVEAFLLDDAGVLTLAKQSRASAYLSGNQSCTNGTWNKVALNAEDYDEQEEFDIATNNRFTAKKAGYYFVAGQVRYNNASVTNAVVYVDVRKNGAEAIPMLFNYTGTNIEFGAICIHIFPLAVNDYLELYTCQVSGATQALRGAYRYNRLAIHKLS